MKYATERSSNKPIELNNKSRGTTNPEKRTMPQRDQTANPRLQDQIKLRHKPNPNSPNPHSIQLSILVIYFTGS